MTLGAKITDSIGRAIALITETDTAARAASERWKLTPWTPHADACDRIASVTFAICYAGKYKAGKTTAVLASVPTLLTCGGMLPVDTLPSTSIPTTFRFGHEPRVFALLDDGTTEELVFSALERIGIDPASHDHDGIAQLLISLPEPLLRNLTLTDCAGLDEAEIRTRTTRRAVRESDIVVAVLRVDEFGGEANTAEMHSLRDMLADGKPHVFMLNRIDGATVDRAQYPDLWESLVTDFGGPKWAGQHLAERRIYEVDAAQAFDARRPGQPPGSEARANAELEHSKIAEFEGAVRRYIDEEGLAIKAAAWIQPIVSQLDGLAGELRHVSAAKWDEREMTQRDLDAVNAGIVALEAAKAAMFVLTAWLEPELTAALRRSWDDLFAVMKADISSSVEVANLDSLKGLGKALQAIFNRKAVNEEILAEMNSAIANYVNDWVKSEDPTSSAAAINRVVGSIIERLARDMEHEAAAAGALTRSAGDVAREHFPRGWTDWRDTIVREQIEAVRATVGTGVGEEIGNAIAGLSIGAASSIAIAVGGAILDFGFITIPLAVVAAIWTILNLGNLGANIKERVARDVRNEMDSLRDNAWSTIQKQLDVVSAKLEKAAKKVIEEEFFAPQQSALQSREQQVQAALAEQGADIALIEADRGEIDRRQRELKALIAAAAEPVAAS